MEYRYIVFVLFLSEVNSAKILGWFACPAKSHQSVFQPIWKELSLRGHEVTVITSDPLNDPKLTNLTELDMNFTYKVWEEINITNMRREIVNYFEIQYYLQKGLEKSIKMAAQTEEVQKILRKPEKYYDLILIEAHHPIVFGLQHKFKAPLIAISSLGIFNFLSYSYGNSVHPALYPDFISDLFGKLTLWEKIDNLHLLIGSYLMNKWIIYPHADKVARSYFGNDMPYIEDVVKNASLLFSYVNPIFSDRKPLAPNTMDFFNVHIFKDEPLSLLIIIPLQVVKTVEEGKVFDVLVNWLSKNRFLRRNNWKVQRMKETTSSLNWTKCKCFLKGGPFATLEEALQNEKT